MPGPTSRSRAGRSSNPFALLHQGVTSSNWALLPEPFLEMAAAFEVALLEDPGVAAARVGKDFPGVVVAVPEEKAVGAVALGGLLDVVQAPLFGLLGAQAPCLVHFGIGVDVEAVVVAARHRLLVLGEDHRVHVVAAEADHERDVARAYDFQTQEFLVEAARRLEVLGAESAVREEARLQRRCLHELYSSLIPASRMTWPHRR